MESIVMTWGIYFKYVRFISMKQNHIAIDISQVVLLNIGIGIDPEFPY